MSYDTKTLKGCSGCLLSVINDGQIKVKKQSHVFEYNKRLRIQCAKQKCFNMYNKTKANAPKIRSFGYNGDLFYFEMDFIYSKTLAEIFPRLPINKIEKLIELLFLHINDVEKKKNINVNKIFQDKISTLIKDNDTNSLKKDAFRLLKEYDFSMVEQSACHGDLTLENILITTDYNLYLIDFLDSFYNSYVIDLAKLFQDIELGWSYRNVDNDTTREVRLLIAKDYLIKQILKMPEGEQLIQAVYHILLLNILRIYPYIKDKRTVDFLNNSCEKVMKIIGGLK